MNKVFEKLLELKGQKEKNSGKKKKNSHTGADASEDSVSLEVRNTGNFSQRFAEG